MIKNKFKMWFKILIACIPAAIVGVLLDDWLDEHLYNYICVAIALIVFRIAFIVVERMVRTENQESRESARLITGTLLLSDSFSCWLRYSPERLAQAQP